MELTLKDQSVIEIGKAVGDNFNSLAGGGTSLVPAGAGAKAGPPAVVAQPMNPFDSMMTVLGDIRDGIYSLVDKFSDSVSLQKDQIQDANMAQDLAQVGESDDAQVAPSGEQNKSFFAKAKEKVGSLMGAGGIKGMLMKGGLIIGLLGLAKFLQKFGRQIAETITGIIDGVKEGYNNVKDFFMITVPEKFKEWKDGVVNFFTITVPEKIEEIKTTISEWFTSIKTGIKDFWNKIVNFFTVTIPTKVEEAKTVIGEWFESIKTNVTDLFTRIKNFFVITIPEKVQAIKDGITEWFTNIVDEAKGIFTKVKDFFVITIPTKVQEIKDSITDWFENIKNDVVGIFTKVKNFVFVTIPTKLKEIEASIENKVGEIKDKIIEFATAPFKKIKELMKNLLVGILESVEGLPFIGDKAKALKEKILGTGGEAGTETVGTAGTGDASIAENIATQNTPITTDESGNVVGPDGNLLKLDKKDEAAAISYATELSKMGQGKFEAVYDDNGVFGKAFYRIKKTGEAVTGTGTTTTGGATGGEISSTSAEMAASQGAAMGGGAFIGGNTTQVSNNSVQHTSIDEKTGVSDTKLGDDLQSD